MVFTTNVETKIGFDKIRQLLVKNCLSPLGTKKVDTITVSTNYEWILEQLNQTNEFVKILVFLQNMRYFRINMFILSQKPNLL